MESLIYNNTIVQPKFVSGSGYQGKSGTWYPINTWSTNAETVSSIIKDLIEGFGEKRLYVDFTYDISNGAYLHIASMSWGRRLEWAGTLNVGLAGRWSQLIFKRANGEVEYTADNPAYDASTNITWFLLEGPTVSGWWRPESEGGTIAGKSCLSIRLSTVVAVQSINNVYLWNYTQRLDLLAEQVEMITSRKISKFDISSYGNTTYTTSYTSPYGYGANGYRLKSKEASVLSTGGTDVGYQYTNSVKWRPTGKSSTSPILWAWQANTIVVPPLQNLSTLTAQCNITQITCSDGSKFYRIKPNSSSAHEVYVPINFFGPGQPALLRVSDQCVFDNLNPNTRTFAYWRTHDEIMRVICWNHYSVTNTPQYYNIMTDSLSAGVTNYNWESTTTPIIKAQYQSFTRQDEITPSYGGYFGPGGNWGFKDNFRFYFYVSANWKHYHWGTSISTPFLTWNPGVIPLGWAPVSSDRSWCDLCYCGHLEWGWPGWNTLIDQKKWPAHAYGGGSGLVTTFYATTPKYVPDYPTTTWNGQTFQGVAQPNEYFFQTVYEGNTGAYYRATISNSQLFSTRNPIDQSFYTAVKRPDHSNFGAWNAIPTEDGYYIDYIVPPRDLQTDKITQKPAAGAWSAERLSQISDDACVCMMFPYPNTGIDENLHITITSPLTPANGLTAQVRWQSKWGHDYPRFDYVSNTATADPCTIPVFHSILIIGKGTVQTKSYNANGSTYTLADNQYPCCLGSANDLNHSFEITGAHSFKVSTRGQPTSALVCYLEI